MELLIERERQRESEREEKGVFSCFFFVRDSGFFSFCKKKKRRETETNHSFYIEIQKRLF